MMKFMKNIIVRVAAIVALVAATVAGCTPLPTPEGEDQLTVDVTTLTLDQKEGIASFNLIANVAWTISCSADWLTILPTSGSGSSKVLCGYQENSSANGRNAKIEIAPVEAGLVPSHTILVLQDGTNGGNNGDNGENGDDNGDNGGDTPVPPAPEGVIEATVAEFLKAEVNTTQWYQLTGTITNLTNTTYGNFDLQDESGWVLIYGLCANKVDKNDKSFSSLGLKEGDIVTLHTLRSEHNGQPQGGGSANAPAYYICHTPGESGGNEGGGNQDNPNGSEKTYRTGWAELPDEEPNNSDYYYAHHIIPDVSGQVRNFSVCYSESLGCPVWVASPMHSYYTQKNTSRSDAYAPDPDIPSSIQVHKRSGYTRGHMLGSADRLVSVGANHQAFYYSNIAPQLSSGFNTGGGVWNNLESFCDQQLCADTLYMVNGCYWANHNKVSSGTVIPTHYYKVLLRTKKGNSKKWVVNCSADELKCVVFMVEHNSSQHGVKPHKGMMMSVAELEELTGHKFFTNVPNAPKETFNPSDWGL